MKINKDTVLGEVLETPGAEKALERYKVPCVSCPLAQMEMNILTLGQIANRYDLDLEGMLKELN